MGRRTRVTLSEAKGGRIVTNEELAKFRGEFLGLKILVLSCVWELAQRQADPEAFLNDVRERAAREIANADPIDVRRAHLDVFREAAEKMVVRAVDAD